MVKTSFVILSILTFCAINSFLYGQGVEREDKYPSRSRIDRKYRDERSLPPHLRKQMDRKLNRRFLVNPQGFPEHEGDERDLLSPRDLWHFQRREEVGMRTAIEKNKGFSYKFSTVVAADTTIETSWVAHYASGLLASVDDAVAIVIDPTDSSIIVTGSSTTTFTKEDFFTIKYSSKGDTLWTARYNGVCNYNDYPTALTVDNFGNVYVTGVRYDSVTGDDCATIKYSSSGIQQWVVCYNVAGSSTEHATAIAVDALGNVYITGRSCPSGVFARGDYATVKYNRNGVQQWDAHYDDPGHFNDLATAIGLDGQGNVYVTGLSDDFTTNYDYATIKYDSNGIQKWISRYNRSGQSVDWPSALAVDAHGNVYVTGESGFSFIHDYTYDYATVKYNSNGVEEWTAVYNGSGNYYDAAHAIALDLSGNVYVTGGSYGLNTSQDYATIKYDSNGIEQWLTRYNGPGNNGDQANAIAVDDSGNIYVTGVSFGSSTWYDYATIKYNSIGFEQWVTRYNGTGNYFDAGKVIGVDALGNVYVTGESNGTDTFSDYATIKYNSSGVQQWAARYNGPGQSQDYARSIAIDTQGNVYVTGESYNSGNWYDYATIKYNSNGVEQWVARYNGPGNDYDIPSAIAVDAYSNVFVTGKSYGLDGFPDYATIKYDSNGVQQWIARYNGPGNFIDEAAALGLDAQGNVYVTGASYDSASGCQYSTIKYDSDGKEQWVSHYNGYGNYDMAVDLVVDKQGNVYVTGYSYAPETDFDYVTIMYNERGVQQWIAQYNRSGNEYDHPVSIGLDESGNVYVAGYSGIWPNYDYTTLKYNNSGIEQWVSQYDGPANDWDEVSALSVDIDGNTYVTGFSLGSDGSADYATIKYDSSGIQRWIARYSGPGIYDDSPVDLVIDSKRNVYVTGVSSLSGTPSSDYITIKYDDTGIQQWVGRYNGPGNSADEAAALVVDNQQNVYVTGYSYVAGGSVYTTIKYVQKQVSVIENEQGIPYKYFLYQNYPNPFNPSTEVSFIIGLPAEVSHKGTQAGHSSFVTLKVYDVLGREIATLVNERKQAGEYKVTWNAEGVPSGVYFYRIVAGEFTQTKKMVVMK